MYDILYSNYIYTISHTQFLIISMTNTQLCTNSPRCGSSLPGSIPMTHETSWDHFFRGMNPPKYSCCSPRYLVFDLQRQVKQFQWADIPTYEACYHSHTHYLIPTAPSKAILQQAIQCPGLWTEKNMFIANMVGLGVTKVRFYFLSIYISYTNHVLPWSSLSLLSSLDPLKHVQVTSSPGFPILDGWLSMASPRQLQPHSWRINPPLRNRKAPVDRWFIPLENPIIFYSYQ